MKTNQQEKLSRLLHSLEISAWRVGHHEACVTQYAAMVDDWKSVGDAENLKHSMERLISARQEVAEAKQDATSIKAKIMELCYV